MWRGRRELTALPFTVPSSWRHSCCGAQQERAIPGTQLYFQSHGGCPGWADTCSFRCFPGSSPLGPPRVLRISRAAVLGWLIPTASSWPPQWYGPQPAWQRETAGLSGARTFPVPLVYNVASLGLSLETQLPYIFLEARHLCAVSWGHASCWQQWKDDFMRLAACAPVSASQAGRRLGFFLFVVFFYIFFNRRIYPGLHYIYDSL